MNSQRSAAEVLREARAIIEDPDRWCQDHWAVDEKGKPAPTTQGCRWCAEGALILAGRDGCGAFGTWDALYKALPKAFTDIGSYNDSRTHRSVLRLYDRAIEIAEKSR